MLESMHYTTVIQFIFWCDK
uniref:Predicted protein n=1 Tax=Hordeum vulgare subsp. vulgare TaxID=112509 RepID=F2D8Z4_HORVV|nr:predicted protein [Hordeum vulgare subsp. vulgare]